MVFKGLWMVFSVVWGAFQMFLKVLSVLFFSM